MNTNKEQRVLLLAIRENLTKGELFSTRKNWQTARTKIRKHANEVYKSKNNTSCEKCGYNKHIEVCHIKPVSDFDNSAKLSEINNITNLIGLCPNCHWEFDNLS